MNKLVKIITIEANEFPLSPWKASINKKPSIICAIRFGIATCFKKESSKTIAFILSRPRRILNKPANNKAYNPNNKEKEQQHNRKTIPHRNIVLPRRSIKIFPKLRLRSGSWQMYFHFHIVDITEKIYSGHDGKIRQRKRAGIEMLRLFKNRERKTATIS